MPTTAVSTDATDSANEAGLRYVSDTRPGIRRKRAGKGFSYLDPDGKLIRDPATLRRIRALAIPPAYTDVWISAHPLGHIQATGRDARGRKQYRYHARWRAVRDATKFGRMLDFSHALPAIRKRVDQDLALSGLPRERVLATIVRLLESTGIRVGNEEYARSNRSFGLTTLRNRHVEISGSRISFEFRGKSGKTVSLDLSDRRVARILQRCQEIPGEELFQYLDEEGKRQSIDSGDVNEYLREIGGENFTAKDFRTWSGTMLAAEVFQEIGAPADEAESKKNILAAIDRVAERLNNTRAVCRRYYIHPAILEQYAAGTLLDALKLNGGAASTNGDGHLPPDEAAVLRLLKSAN
ncbi:MAG: DNA topoisomerase IB [Gemmatimonadota bacterium]